MAAQRFAQARALRAAAKARCPRAGRPRARRPGQAGIAFREDGDYEAYYTALGVVVRKYLADRYDFPAYALTTRELESQMRDRGLDRWQIRVAGGLFTQCDSVVYARYRPATERAEHDLTAAYEIVEMSRPLDLDEATTQPREEAARS